MKDYTNSNPVFSDTIRITEPTDPAHADHINEAPKQLLQNTLLLYEAFMSLLDEGDIEAIFLQTFTKVGIPASGAMTPQEIEEAIATEWNGEASKDPGAMTPPEIESATVPGWNGESSEDTEALTASEIEEAIS